MRVIHAARACPAGEKTTFFAKAASAQRLSLFPALAICVVRTMPKHFGRPHIGKVPMKFYFRAQEISVVLPGLDVTGKLVLTWKRGPRRTTTEPFPVKEKLNQVDGSLVRSATTSQDLALICTMFKNSKSGAFESKRVRPAHAQSAAFTLKEELDGGEERKLGSVTIDLSSYATPEVSSDAVELSFCEGKVLLKFQLSSHWLKHSATRAGT
eukprot:7045569-Prymnesium_polylepis.1